MDIKWAGQLLIEAGLWFSAFPTLHLTDEGMVNHVMVITVHETPFQTQDREYDFSFLVVQTSQSQIRGRVFRGFKGGVKFLECTHLVHYCHLSCYA